MATTISRRLATIIPHRNTEVKLNGNSYYSGYDYSNDVVDADETNFVLNFTVPDYNYFCFNKNSKITCWPNTRGEQPLNESGKWKLEGRQEMKPGKFLMQFATKIVVRDDCGDQIQLPDMRDKVIARLCEIFTDSLRGTNAPIHFDLSSEIDRIYSTHAQTDSGYLRSSCMRPNSGHDCNQYSAFYNYVPGLRIVHKIVGAELLFRALLWDCKDRSGQPVTFLDRIYGTEVHNIQLISHAKEQGWAYRTFGNCDIIKDDKRIDLLCNIPNTAFEYLSNEGSPYMDTLGRLSKNGKGWILSNYLSADYYLQECDGDAVRQRIHCCCCGDGISADDRYNDVNGDSYCEGCFDARYCYCAQCGEVTCNDNSLYIHGETWCIHCATRAGYAPCYSCGTWTDNINEIADNNYCTDCVSEHFTECEHCGDFHRNEEVNAVIWDGTHQTVCRTCLEDNAYQCLHCGDWFTVNHFQTFSYVHPAKTIPQPFKDIMKVLLRN